MIAKLMVAKLQLQLHLCWLKLKKEVSVGRTRDLHHFNLGFFQPAGLTATFLRGQQNQQQPRLQPGSLSGPQGTLTVDSLDFSQQQQCRFLQNCGSLI